MISTPLTMGEIENLSDDVLTCVQVSKVLKSEVAALHKQAVTNPATLGFPVIVVGTRVKIPRIPFIKYMRGELPCT